MAPGVDQKDVVIAFIRRYEIIEKFGAEAPEADNLFWCLDAIDAAGRNDPEIGLELIQKILEGTTNQYVLANLAAGPLESLLVRSGAAIIDKIEARARHSERFRQLLKGVWRNRIDEGVWTRLQNAFKA